MSAHPDKSDLRIVMCASGTVGVETLAKFLEAEGCSTTKCASHEILLEELLRNNVDAIVLGFSPPYPLEPALLRMVRRLQPDTPLIIVAPDATLEMERMIRDYRPLFVAVPPWDRSEMRSVVRAVRSQRARKGDPTAHAT